MRMPNAGLSQTIAESLRKRRYELRLTQKSVAEIAGCHWTLVSDIEREKPTVRLDKVLDVLRAVGLDLRLAQHVDGS